MSVSLESIEGGIAILKIDRPQVRNALDWDAMYAFRDCVESAHAMTDLRAFIVSGSNETFIAGGDLKALHRFTSEEDGVRLSREMTLTLEMLEALPCPTIAAINGPARGGGAEICLACDLRIISTNADIGFVQIKLGLVPGWGAGQRLLHLVGYSLALEWLSTGRILSAEEALAFGLVNTLTPPGQALSTAIDLAQQVASNPVPAVRAIKRILRAGVYLPPSTAASFEGAEFPTLWAAKEHIQAVQRFLDNKT